MKKRKFTNYQIFSVIFTFVFGTLLHFTYELSGDNLFVGIFSAVNESVWEHLKLLFFPMLITTILGYFYLGKDNYICSKILGIIIAMIFTIVFFYTYTGILGQNIAIIDISSFFIAVLLGEYVAYVFMKNNLKCSNFKSIITVVILFFCFIVFTVKPPDIGLFQDPITGEYGRITSHKKDSKNKILFTKINFMI